MIQNSQRSDISTRLIIKTLQLRWICTFQQNLVLTRDTQIAQSPLIHSRDEAFGSSLSSTLDMTLDDLKNQIAAQNKTSTNSYKDSLFNNDYERN